MNKVIEEKEAIINLRNFFGEKVKEILNEYKKLSLKRNENERNGADISGYGALINRELCKYKSYKFARFCVSEATTYSDIDVAVKTIENNVRHLNNSISYAQERIKKGGKASELKGLLDRIYLYKLEIKFNMEAIDTIRERMQLGKVEESGVSLQ